MVRPYSDDDDDDDDDEDGVACAISDGSGKYRKSKFDKNASCKYCKKSGHVLDDCFKLKNKKEWEAKQNESKSQSVESDTPSTNQGN